MPLVNALPSIHNSLKTHADSNPNPNPLAHPAGPTRTPTLSRRLALSSLVAQVLLAGQASASDPNHSVMAIDFIRKTEPEPTAEEAEEGLRDHAQALLSVKALIESRLWSEAQKELRRSSSSLKRDMYVIIQKKPGSERPLLRKLYSELFNGVSRMDYASRDRDEARVWQYYDNIVLVLHDILSRI